MDNVPSVKYFSDCLTWNIDGSIGLFYRKDRFSLSEKVIPLIPYPEYKNKIDLDYVRHIIMGEVLKNPFSFSNKGGKTRLGQIKLQIPCNENGEWLIGKQKDLSALFETKEQRIFEIQDNKECLKSVFITIPIDKTNYLFKTVPITKLFDIERGSGKYTKSYVQKHKGEYCLYSGNTNGVFAAIDSFDYHTPCLSWTIDGLAGYMMVHKDKFSATNHRGVMVLKSEYTSSVSLEYIKYYLEPIFREKKKGREGDNGENEYTSLPPFMIKKYQLIFQ